MNATERRRFPVREKLRHEPLRNLVESAFGESVVDCGQLPVGHGTNQYEIWVSFSPHKGDGAAEAEEFERLLREGGLMS